MTYQKMKKMIRKAMILRKKRGLKETPLYSEEVIMAIDKTLELKIKGSEFGMGREELRAYLQLISSDEKLEREFIENYSKITLDYTFPGRLDYSIKAIRGNLHFLGKKEEIVILDVGVGNVISDEGMGITTKELARGVNNSVVYGGDILFSEGLMIIEYIGKSKVVFFNFDILNPKTKKGIPKTFDVIRCCNLLTHFQWERIEEAIENMLKLAQKKALVIYDWLKDEMTKETILNFVEEGEIKKKIIISEK